MPISIVVGGQFGSEGKGKVAAYFSNKLGVAATIRVGGPNSGHTVYNNARDKFILKQLPTSSIYDNNFSVIAAGSYINLKILKEEINLVNLNRNNLIIDPKAIIITEEDIQSEQQNLKERIGSTASGTGFAVKRRIERKHNNLFAKDVEELQNYISPTVPILRDFLNKNQRILIEGTQGFGLSLLHSEHYPYTTSRDTTASGFLSEVGLSPLDVDDVILVIRTFPIRVAGNSGPLDNEIDWNYVTETSGSNKNIIEYTSVSNNVRRVGLFDPKIVKKAIEANHPTKVVMNHLDYINIGNKEKNLCEFLSRIEKQINRKLDYLGFNPYELEIKKTNHQSKTYV